MDRASISELTALLQTLDISSETLMGYGGESWVFALDEKRIARINRPSASQDQVASRTALLAELGRSAGLLPFAIPQVLDAVLIEGYAITFEVRLPGRPASQVLAESRGEARDALIRAYLSTAAALGDLRLRRPWYGDLLAAEPIRQPTFGAYLERRARHSLGQAGPAFQQVDARHIAAALPEPPQPAFVHLDAFLDNMLAQGEVITAVLDFGTSTMIGDRRLDPLAAVAYLAPQITPGASDRDRAVAQEWLEQVGLSFLYPAARKWLAAYWSFATDDIPLHQWCRQILAG